MQIETVVTVLVGILGILGVIDSGIQRYNKATTSKYAAQRDFEHLRRNQEQLKQSMSVIMSETDELKEDSIRVRTQLETLIKLYSECKSE